MDIEMSLHKITVGGYVDQKMVLKTVRKIGRREELWPLNPYQLVTLPLSPRQVILYIPLLYIPKFIIIIESTDTMGVFGISSLQMKMKIQIDALSCKSEQKSTNQTK